MATKVFLAASALILASPALAASSKYLITFGDSYSQTGFDISGEKPSSSNPLGNPPFPGWTASGGVNWVGSMAAEVNSSLVLAYNFAYGGATVDADIVTPYLPTVHSMEDQVDLFVNNLAKRPDYAPWKASNTLAGVWMGVNDVGNSHWAPNVTDIMEASVARYFELLQVLYDSGLRRFVLLSVPPTNLTPTMLNQGEENTSRLISAIALFNGHITSKLRAFKKTNRQAKITLVDTSRAFNKAVKNPTAYGAPDALCINPDGVSCLWMDGYHPGVAIERLVAKDVVNDLKADGFKW
ncbi:hypothetical protein NCS57_00501600 [Fusarium keratoplasticum]|uniref:Uncharacterized protein n=1 Tax=Fusarium keratoplasticum TaxID=1328300 RepID=A0ACC0R8N0_9HYPO|nr:hypothetical protein NCS57_00501600 [Fusarium keratoplasticum]KAI8675987.1 hypothetical protein NCS57_00501600 [Fusarium keratoplasticum]